MWYNKKTGVVEIQEIQSDLFQKGRDKEDLINDNPIPSKYKGNLDAYLNDIKLSGNVDLYNRLISAFSTKDFSQNQFLQLLRFLDE